MAKRGDTDRPAFTETLRALDDLSELDVYEFRLLIHLWRVGVSWESMRTLAGKCNMSIGKVSQVQKALLDKGYLVHQERGGRVGLAVNVRSQDEQERSPHEQTQQVGSSNRSSHERGCSPHEQNVHHMNAILNQPYKTTNEEEEEAHPPAPATPLQELADHFRRRTALTPNGNTPNYKRDWQEPLDAILLLAGNDLKAACALIDRALAVARGDNEQRKVYTVSAPRSLVGMASNIAAAQQVRTADANADDLWRQALAVVTGTKTNDSRLLTAIRAIGADRIRMARESDAPRLKQELAHGYYRPVTTAA